MMHEDMLDNLIGKYLDSEITPAEKALLDRELAQNAAARELLGHMEQLRDAGREALAGELAKTRSVEETWERALKAHERKQWWGRMGWRGVARAAGLAAAGFVLGVLVQGVLTWEGGTEQVRQLGEEQAVVVEGERDEGLETAAGDGARGETVVEKVMEQRKEGEVADKTLWRRRRIDPPVIWYSFEDAEGRQWLMESYDDRSVQRAAYHGGL